MAKKSKTQRAKASAARQAKKEERARLEADGVVETMPEAGSAEQKTEQKKSLFKKSADASDKPAQTQDKAAIDKNKTPSIFKRCIGFFKDVRSELKRVTWPTREDVLRWSAVVVIALLFFGIYVVILDGIVTQILVGISGLSGFVQ